MNVIRAARLARWRIRASTRRALWSHPLVRRAVTGAFARLYYYSRERTWSDTRWLGVPALKCPLDMWVYQELIAEIRPNVIVETGTAHGGSALYLANMFDLVGSGRVITVDAVALEEPPEHERITFVTGSSVDPEIVGRVRSAIRPGERVMVILDSDHSRDHVLAELRAYSELVSPGSYLIVEDTNVNGHPVLPEHGPGPTEAVRDFLRTTSDFAVDRGREKFMLTFNPRGYLRRAG